MRLGDTPVPIPNTMVKTYAADGTLLETVRESRWLPGYKKFISAKEININVRTPCGFATLCSGD